MVDACGWEIIKNDSFCKDFAPHRHRLGSVFGYSSTCVPSILSGRWPCEHRNWCYFVYDPKNSPFRSLRPLRWLPRAVTSRRIFRRYLTKMVKSHLNFRGYFDLYNIPFQYISLYDFTEKKSPLKAGGMNKGPNIFDFLEIREIPYFVSDPAKTEEGNLANLREQIEAEAIDFAFMYWAGLDGLLHRVGNQSPEVPARLRIYEEWMRAVLALANDHYSEVHLYVFSDHGMANCDELLDLKGMIDTLPVEMEKDYAVVYDSTMARFWFFNDHARSEITNCLGKVPQGRIIPDSELEEMNAFFPDGYFGELIFLVKEGVLIVPSHMGERPIRAMHGYHPTDKHSYASLMTNQSALRANVSSIPDIFRLMTAEAQAAQAENRPDRPAAIESSSTLTPAI
ncbi:MAG: Type phosphodiesterase/nucleotide pyrophosphatase [Verrucomicrobiales bacterium]|nr:Type phosphodiesterase/nucleotide pyrophosphatase [Verrucomicrobiales bacterium]